MSGKSKRRSHSTAVKLAAVRRVKAGESVIIVARSFKVRRTQLYVWLKQLREQGVVGKPRGRPRSGSMAAPGSAGREVELERLVGRQQVELDFFRQALRRIEEARRLIAGAGMPASGGSSPPGRPGRKAD